VASFLAAAHLDPFDLIASLRTRIGLFKDDGGGTLACPVRRPRDDGKFTIPPYAAAGKWAELNNAIQRVKRLGDQMGGIEFGRIDLELLPAGACMDWRQGGEDEHAILMLRTSPAVTWFCGPEIMMPTTGLLVLVNRLAPRSAINVGDSAAIWLAIDFKRKAEP